MSTTYHVEILGRLWMPQCHAAKQITITPADLERAGYHDVAGMELEEISAYVDTHEGDFSSIEALRVVKLEHVVETPKEKDGWTATTTHTRETMLRDFTDDEQDSYDACYADYEDDEVDA